MDVGLYGKLPSHGDFLRRRASDAFVAAWDTWLQHCMTASRAALASRWLDVYLTSPVWRFACAPGVAGAAPVVGVMAPSVDRVGRYFPLTIVAPLPDDISLVSAALDAERFFGRATQLVVDIFDAEFVDFEKFDADVAGLAGDLSFLGLPRAVDLEAAAAVALADGPTTAWQMPIASPGELGSTLLQLLSHRLSARYAPLTLWWTEGSSDVEPGCLIVKGLPPPDGFAAMLDGSWARHRWESLPAGVDRGAEPDLAILDGRAPLGYRSAARTDVGRARHVNQDAFVERAEIGLWAVADGMGGHADGEVASRMVCDALADLVDGEVQAGDRFLLCSDGLTRTVPDGQIQESMEGPDVAATVERLVAASLAAGAPDNVTVLVAEALADSPKSY